MKNHNKPSNCKQNIDKFKSFWEDKNIELMPKKTKYGWQFRFRFINEDVEFRDSKYINCSATGAWYSCATFVAAFLRDEGAIDEYTYQAYCAQLNRLFNNQCYN